MNRQEPRYEHDCARCVYLGQHGEHDLYFCDGRGGWSCPTVIARYGGRGPDYVSGLAAAGLCLPLSKAAQLAREKGLLS